MKQVHQFKETIGIRIDDRMYRDTDENFALDSNGSVPSLPTDIDERLYEPNVRHALLRDNNVVDGGPQPWPEGDDLLARLDALFAAKQAREEAAVAKMKAEFKAQMEKGMQRT